MPFGLKAATQWWRHAGYKVGAGVLVGEVVLYLAFVAPYALAPSPWLQFLQQPGNTVNIPPKSRIMATAVAVAPGCGVKSGAAIRLMEKASGRVQSRGPHGIILTLSRASIPACVQSVALDAVGVGRLARLLRRERPNPIDPPTPRR